MDHKDIDLVFEAHVKELLAIPGVTDAEIDYKIDEKTQPCIVVYVKKKSTSEDLIPKQLGNWPVEIIESEAVFA